MEQKRRIYELNAEICKALAHPSRLEILDILCDGEYAVEEIAEKAEMQKSNLSQHLAVLRRTNLVTTRRDGLKIYYRIANPKILDACDQVKQVLIDTLMKSGSLASALAKQSHS